MRVRIGDIAFDALGFEETLDAIERLVDGGKGGAVFTANIDHVVRARNDARFREAYAAASISLCDGTPLLWASRALGTPLPAKVAGSDLLAPLLERAARRGFRVYLLGPAPDVAQAAAAKMQREGVTVAGVDSPSVPADGSGDAPALAKLVAAKPQLVIVSLGAPKQELFIQRNAAALRPAVSLGLGASLEFYVGAARRAPRWMQRSGLEWLYRLIREPRRLARRYLVDDPAIVPILWRTARTPRSQRLEQ